jgi:hypothetical protein
MAEDRQSAGDRKCDLELLLAIFGGAFAGVLVSKVFERIVNWVLAGAGL